MFIISAIFVLPFVYVQIHFLWNVKQEKNAVNGETCLNMINIVIIHTSNTCGFKFYKGLQTGGFMQSSILAYHFCVNSNCTLPLPIYLFITLHMQ